MIKLYYRRDGTPYPEGTEGLMEWSMDFENFEGRKIAKTTLPNKYAVSTVWLGLNHAWLDTQPPLIFETMVFNENIEEKSTWFPGSIFHPEVDMERYSTEAEAIAGHERMCEKWRSK